MTEPDPRLSDEAVQKVLARAVAPLSPHSEPTPVLSALGRAGYSRRFINSIALVGGVFILLLVVFLFMRLFP